MLQNCALHGLKVQRKVYVIEPNKAYEQDIRYGDGAQRYIGDVFQPALSLTLEHFHQHQHCCRKQQHSPQ
jgi:hypothetical protein